MENNRVIAEISNLKLELESALSYTDVLLEKIKEYDYFSKNNKSADIILYLAEIEETNEKVDKDLYNSLIRCHALTDVLNNEIKSFDKE